MNEDDLNSGKYDQGQIFGLPEEVNGGKPIETLDTNKDGQWFGTQRDAQFFKAPEETGSRLIFFSNSEIIKQDLKETGST